MSSGLVLVLPASYPFMYCTLASDHSIGLLENTLSRVLSSYTPTIKALSHSRGCATTVLRKDNDDLKLLLLAIHRTLGEWLLTRVTIEKTVVQVVVESSF